MIVCLVYCLHGKGKNDKRNCKLGKCNLSFYSGMNSKQNKAVLGGGCTGQTTIERYLGEAVPLMYMDIYPCPKCQSHLTGVCVTTVQLSTVGCI